MNKQRGVDEHDEHEQRKDEQRKDEEVWKEYQKLCMHVKCDAIIVEKALREQARNIEKLENVQRKLKEICDHEWERDSTCGYQEVAWFMCHKCGNNK